MGTVRYQPPWRVVRPEEGPPRPVRRVHAAAARGARAGRGHPRRQEQPDAGGLTASRSSRATAGDPFEALGDPNRRAIVELLAARGEAGRSVGELADALPISRPAVSRHLRLLKSAGLVVEEPRGTRRIYRLHEDGVAAVQEYLTRVWGDAIARFTLTAENVQPKSAKKPTR